MSELAPFERNSRFKFGKNWRQFLGFLNEDRLDRASQSLTELTGRSDFHGVQFLDVGSGSGIFSLSAYRKGAEVTSFDYDEESVRCTEMLREKYSEGNNTWRCMQGSVLDEKFLRSLGQYDIVYAWGVVHHTGNIWTALGNVSETVSPDGTLIVSVYNDQGWLSEYWRLIKIAYNQAPYLRPLLIVVHAPYLVIIRYLVRLMTGRAKLERGMSYWHDMLDWLGGYPFEVAKPEDVFEFLRRRGLTLSKLRTCGGRSGCNEFVFQRAASDRTQ